MMHQGSWTSVLIEKDQVTGVEFRNDPEGAEKEDYECQEIFRECVA